LPPVVTLDYAVFESMGLLMWDQWGAYIAAAGGAVLLVVFGVWIGFRLARRVTRRALSPV
jgi:hypothetical protein